MKTLGLCSIHRGHGGSCRWGLAVLLVLTFAMAPRTWGQAPSSLAGYDCIATVAIGTGNLAGIRTIRIVIDPADNYYTQTLIAPGYSQTTSGSGLSYTYAGSGNTGTLDLTRFETTFRLALTFSSATTGSFSGSDITGEPGSATGSFTATPLGTTVLQNNVAAGPLSEAIEGGQKYFKISVPPGQGQLAIRATAGGTPIPLDMLVRYLHPASPALLDYDVRSWTGPDVLTVQKPGSGDWYITLWNDGSYSDGQLIASYQSVSTCQYSLGPQYQAVEWSGGSNQVQVTASNGCTWTAASEADWIIITSNAQGFGNQSVTYSVAVNTTGASRMGLVTVADQVLTVYQQAGMVAPDLAPVSLSGSTVSISEEALTYPIILVDGSHYHMPPNDYYLEAFGDYTYAKTGPGSGRVDLTITSGMGTGRRSTIFLVFDSPTTGTFTSASTGGGFPDAFASGTFAGTDLPVKPQIMSPPGPRTILEGGTIVLSVTALGSQPLNYRWQRNGVNLAENGNIQGVASDVLTLSFATAEQSGIYRAVVRNGFGTAISDAAVVEVISAAAARPALQGWRVAARGTIQLQFPSIAGLNYVLLQQSRLDQTPSIVLGNWPGTGGLLSLDVPVTGDRTGFVRVRVE